MKKYNLSYTCIAILMALTSCNDLDETPTGFLDPQTFFTSQSDAQAAVLGAYGNMVSTSDFGRRFNDVVGFPSDELENKGNVVATYSELSNFTTTATHEIIKELWVSIYKTISIANYAIDGIPGIDNMPQANKNQLIAEARAIRAFNYFRLVRLFGDIPYIDQFISKPATVSLIFRTPVAEVYPLVIEDLDFAIQHLLNTYPGNIKGRISKGTALTILADVYLTLGEWAKAAENAEYVINHASEFGYALQQDYKDVFLAEFGDQPEQIWIMDFVYSVRQFPLNVDQLIAETMPNGGCDYNGYNLMVPNIGTYNIFDERDYRKKVSFMTEAPFNQGAVIKSWQDFPVPVPYVNKWHLGRGKNVPIGASAYTDINVNVYRYSEVLLIAAEALNEVNGSPSPKAYQYINQVRERARYHDKVLTDFPADLAPGMSQSVFRESVLFERRLEFAFEMKRWFDITRRNLFQEAYTGANSTEPHATWKSYFPIPQSELDINPNLTQNPEYQ